MTDISRLQRLAAHTRVSLLSVALLLAGAQISAASTISTLGSWDGTAALAPFGGEIGSATYGQTFVAPSIDSVMDSFTFYLDDDSYTGDVVEFAGYVAAWDGTKATGPMLYTSGPLATNNNGGAGGMQAFTLNTGGLNLIGGNQYVAFFSASNFYDGTFGAASMGMVRPNPYADGRFIYANNGADFGLLTTASWIDVGPDDAAFEMTFSAPGAAPVPEPASLLLLGSGVLGAAVRRYRRS